MAGRVIHVPAVSLVGLRLARPERFYAQDWYLRETFARTPATSGSYDPWRVAAPAVVAVWAMLEALRYGETPPARFDTTDTDHAGHPVYVTYGTQGVEVHRNLERVRGEMYPHE